MNGQPLSISDKQEIDEAVLGFDLGYVDEKAGLALDLMRGVAPRVSGPSCMSP